MPAQAHSLTERVTFESIHDGPSAYRFADGRVILADVARELNLLLSSASMQKWYPLEEQLLRNPQANGTPHAQQSPAPSLPRPIPLYAPVANPHNESYEGVYSSRPGDLNL